MGLSTTASYAILFTASLLMLSTLVNSMLYSYYMANEGMTNKNEMIEGSANMIKIDRVVYNSSKIEIIAYNLGPKTLEVEDISVVVNGTITNFSFEGDYWYPGTKESLIINSTYDFGSYHTVQFKIDYGDYILASCESDKIYILNRSAVLAYNFEGKKVWNFKVNSPRDLAVGSYLYVLNSTRILKYDLNGNYVSSFGTNLGILSIDVYKGFIYAVSNTTFYIFDQNGTLTKSLTITNGRDIAIGKDVYILSGNTIYIYDYSGNLISSFTDSRITNATCISADWNMAGYYIFILNSHNEILVYQNSTYKDTIPLDCVANNIDIYGKIYVSSSGLWGMDIGYRVKVVDEYGNEIYTHL